MPKAGPSRLFAACDAYPAAKRATANRERTVAFAKERLAIVKDRLGDMLLSTIARETIEGFQAKRKLDGVSNRPGQPRSRSSVPPASSVALLLGEPIIHHEPADEPFNVESLIVAR